MSGLGHPESADLTGYTAAYFVQQMMDFRSGARQDFARRMDGFAKAMTDEEIRQAAEYFASLPRKQFNRVVEAAMVPRTFVGQGRMRFIDPKQTGMEPIGDRIITVPENENMARLRDPRAVSGFVSYVRPAASRRERRSWKLAVARASPASSVTATASKGLVMCRGWPASTRSTSRGNS